MRFVLVNESQSTAANQGGTLTPSILQDIAVAVSWQLNGDVAAEWGGSGTYSVRLGQPNGSDVQPTRWRSGSRTRSPTRRARRDTTTGSPTAPPSSTWAATAPT